MLFDEKFIGNRMIRMGLMMQEFEWTKMKVEPEPLILPETVEVREALTRVLRLPAVASKRYLTNKVSQIDRILPH